MSKGKPTYHPSIPFIASSSVVIHIHVHIPVKTGVNIQVNRFVNKLVNMFVYMPVNIGKTLLQIYVS